MSPKYLKTVGKIKKTYFFPQNRDSDSPGQKLFGLYCNMRISLSFLRTPLKQCIIFEIFLHFSLPPPYTKLKLGKILDTRVQHCLWGEGRGLDLCELENAPETQKCPKTFVHHCRTEE